jgi:hypothetical protein
MQISKFSLWICALILGGTLTVRAADTPAQAAARSALEQKMHELDANPSAAAPAAAATATAIEVTPAGATPVVETPAPAPTATAATAAPIEAAPAMVKDEPKNASIKPVAAVNSPVPMSQEEKLRRLLARYKADQITPAEYHTQRAAILAKP